MSVNKSALYYSSFDCSKHRSPSVTVCHNSFWRFCLESTRLIPLLWFGLWEKQYCHSLGFLGRILIVTFFFSLQPAPTIRRRCSWLDRELRWSIGPWGCIHPDHLHSQPHPDGAPRLPVWHESVWKQLFALCPQFSLLRCHWGSCALAGGADTGGNLPAFLFLWLGGGIQNCICLCKSGACDARMTHSLRICRLARKL